jgi:hypothetical protein
MECFANDLEAGEPKGKPGMETGARSEAATLTSFSVQNSKRQQVKKLSQTNPRRRKKHHKPLLVVGGPHAKATEQTLFSTAT